MARQCGGKAGGVDVAGTESARMGRLVVLLSLALLTACVPDAPQPPVAPETAAPAQRGEDARAACTLRGGRVSIAGFSGVQFCAEPMPDGGQACTRAPDCAAGCDADTRTCVTHPDPFGCQSLMNEDGTAEPAICVG